MSRIRARLVRFWPFFIILGPGIITANAGNDAGGIFTYSNIGAKYGLSLLWVFIPLTLGLIVIQEMVARLGCVTGKGLMDLVRERFGVRMTLFAAAIVLVANTGTMLAEFAGIAGGLGLLGVPRTPAVLGAAALLLVVIVRGNRRAVERVFLALGLTFFAYIITAFVVQPHWGTVATSFLIPNFAHPGTAIGVYVVDVVALIGTSITPYMQLFLQSSVVDKGSSEHDLGFVRADVILGSIFSVTVAAFIVITTAVTLFPHGLAGIGVSSAQDAANALQPLAGSHASQLFAVGLVGASLLAAAVMPLSTAFVVCEAFGAERSVQRRLGEAPTFFAIVTGMLALGAAVMLIPTVPIASVAIGTQTVDGMLLPFLLVFILILANDKRLLGKHRNRSVGNVVGISVAGVLTLLTGFLVLTTLFPGVIG